MFVKRVILAATFLVFSLIGQQMMTIDDLWSMKRIGGMKVDPISGDVILKVTSYNADDNKGTTQYYIIRGDSTQPEVLIESSENLGGFTWHDGGIIGLRHDGDSTSLLSYSFEDKKLEEIDKFPYPVGSFSAQSNLITFISNEFPEANSPHEAAELEKKYKNRKSSGEIYDELLFRHWDSWLYGRYNHLYIYDLRNKKPFNLTPGKKSVPPIGLGSGHDVAISPDGEIMAFVRNPDSSLATSTNNEIYIYNHVSKEIKIISSSPGNDNAPHFSPNGRRLAFLSMARAGFEADQRKIWIYDVRDDELKEAKYDLDVSVNNLTWGKNSEIVYFTADYQGYRSLFRYNIITNETKLLLKEVFITGIELVPGKNQLYLLNQSFNMPTELFRFDINSKELTQLTFFNKEILDQISFGNTEDFSFSGADGDTVHGWLLYPPNFQPNKKYGLLHIIHGGPQGATGNSFHYRWNMQLFATFGYVVAAINFHGSTGYGQAFTDRISGDWGGAPFEDIMKGTDYLLQRYSFLDSSSIGAAGASYGGFMINWINGHTDRFNALVCHDGVFDQRSMYGATEELWFPEWDLKGNPYEAPEQYEKFSPSFYVTEMKTPTLIIHGELDYRVPLTQGLQAFTALQRMGVPSKFLYFPDENHFVQKPQNSILWWKTVYDWFQEYMPSNISQ